MRHRQQRLELGHRWSVGINHRHTSIQFADDGHGDWYGHERPDRFRYHGE